MNYVKNSALIFLLSFFLQSCMMPLGMTSMSTDYITDSKVKEFSYEGFSVNGNYALDLKTLISENNGSSKFFLKLRNLAKKKTINDFESEMNLYTVPRKNATLSETMESPIVERLPFLTTSEGNYLNYAFLLPGEYYLAVKVTSVNGSILIEPLLFKYRFSYRNSENNRTTEGFWGMNYWTLGAVLGGVMLVMMLGAY